MRGLGYLLVPSSVLSYVRTWYSSFLSLDTAVLSLVGETHAVRLVNLLKVAYLMGGAQCKGGA